MTTARIDPIDTPPAHAAVLREICVLRDDFRDYRKDTSLRFDDVLAEVRTTNGRLRRVELWIAGLKAIGAVALAFIPFAVFLLSRML